MKLPDQSCERAAFEPMAMVMPRVFSLDHTSDGDSLESCPRSFHGGVPLIDNALLVPRVVLVQLPYVLIKSIERKLIEEITVELIKSMLTLQVKKSRCFPTAKWRKEATMRNSSRTAILRMQPKNWQAML